MSTRASEQKRLLKLFGIAWLMFGCCMQAHSQPTPAVDEDHHKLLRFPDVHADQIVFVYASDLWRVATSGGIAQRLTTHPGLELFPKFSPDGQWIAFTGQYDGDEQVYVMPSTGGQPRRLTAYPARGPLPARWGYDHQVVGWKPDGSAILFRSHRDHFSINESRLYTVHLSGGLPTPLPMQQAGAGAFSPDGQRILFSPTARDFRTWKRYQGGWAQDLWIYDLNTGASHNVTEHVRTDRDPIWSAQGIVFSSDRDGYLNLYRIAEDGGDLRQLTAHRHDVRWASGDAMGNVVYELFGQLHLLSSTGADRAVSIRVPDDGVHARARNVAVGQQIESYHLDSDGQRLAMVARGDVFSVPVKSGLIRNLTANDSYERLAKWSPDGARIAYVSDATGEEEVWVADAQGAIPPQPLTKGHRMRFYRIEWSPNGTHIAVGDKDGQLHVLDVANGALRVVGQMGAYYIQDFSWSPDGRYLAYAGLQSNFLTSIHIWDRVAERDYQVTSASSNEFSPAWHPSGDYLYFLADREYAPQIGSFEWNYVGDRETSILGLVLRVDGANPFSVDGETQTDSASVATDRPTAIDFRDLDKRIFRAPIASDNFTALSALQDTLLVVRAGPFYIGRGSDSTPKLQAFSIPGGKLRTLADNIQFSVAGYYQLALHGEHVALRRNNRYEVMRVADGSSESVAVTGMRKQITPRAEWHNVFGEVWRRYRDFFYVENMHGYDWQALGTRYRALLPYVAHRSDLNDLLGEMVGELSAGHAYVWGGDMWQPDRPQAGLLGVRFELDTRAQRYRIAAIMPGDNSEQQYRSPLTEVGVRAQPGDYVLAINGRELTAAMNPYELLRDAGAGLVELTVNTRARMADAHRLTVEPITDERDLLYLQWVASNLRHVDKLSSGRVGYVHLADMGAAGIREFIKRYYGQIRKDGLIVDVRGNLGGNISPMVLQRLLRRPFSLGYVRGERFPRVYPWGVGGSRVFTGEIVALADENTMSDGDAFAWTFKQTGLGPLIGTRTWGGVVGTDDTGSLLDGGGVLVPQFAMADLAGRWVVEGEGVAPDIEVLNDPTSLAAGQDRQLDRAIQEVLTRLGTATPGQLPPAASAPVKTPTTSQ